MVSTLINTDIKQSSLKFENSYQENLGLGHSVVSQRYSVLLVQLGKYDKCAPKQYSTVINF